jgi:hypothetical protein
MGPQYGAVGNGLLGQGMPLPPELGMLMSARDLGPQMSAGQAMPYARNMVGQVPAGGFSPRDLFGLAGSGVRAPMVGAGLLGRGLAAADPAERMFSPGIWSFLKGL